MSWPSQQSICVYNVRSDRTFCLYFVWLMNENDRLLRMIWKHMRMIWLYGMFHLITRFYDLWNQLVPMIREKPRFIATTQAFAISIFYYFFDGTRKMYPFSFSNQIAVPPSICHPEVNGKMYGYRPTSLSTNNLQSSFNSNIAQRNQLWQRWSPASSACTIVDQAIEFNSVLCWFCWLYKALAYVDQIVSSIWFALIN